MKEGILHFGLYLLESESVKLKSNGLALDKYFI